MIGLKEVTYRLWKKNLRRVDICIQKIDSLYCTAETNTF